METIRSSSNPLIQRVRAVAAGREPDTVLLEGDLLVEEALRRGWPLADVLVAEDRPQRIRELVDRGLSPRAVHPDLLRRVASQASPQGTLALAPRPPLRAPGDLELSADALVLVVAGVQDPGNLGALARTAEAAGAAALASMAGGCSPWNPKALRGSMGSLLRLPLVAFDDARAAGVALAAAGFRNVLAATRGGREPRDLDWSGRIALWISAESGRLGGGEEGAPGADFERVSIPVDPRAESLNVTAAAAVLLFAAGRVRGVS